VQATTYVLDGAVEHRDSLGTRSVIPAGNVQRMTAGTGIMHSEFNPSPSEPLHFLQIWIIPGRLGLKPGYEQKSIGSRTRGKLSLVASPKGGDDVLTINQDVELYVGTIDGGKLIEKEINKSRKAYVQVARGRVSLDGIDLIEGDGVKIVESGN
jgi:redox-sensitive bicupin YhaK (pirin superfamily)